MTSCKQCGAEIPDSAITCPTCGAPVGDPVIPHGKVQSTSTGADASNSQSADRPRKPKKGLLIGLLVVVLLFAIGAIGSCSRSCSEAASAEDWPTGSLAQMIPNMNRKCKFVSESERSLSIRVTDRVSKSDYEKYVAECKERGFTIDTKESSDKFKAYDAAGYEVNVDYSTSGGNELSISLKAPKANSELVWPAIGLAAKIPNPGKTKGSIANDSASSFTAYVGDMDKAAYDAYVSECIQAGFNIDHSKYEESYSAENANGDSLHVNYEGFNTMYVSIHAPYGSKGSSSSVDPSSSGSLNASTSSTASTISNASSTPSTDFKKAMDDYELMMDGYIEFMEKYNSSDNTASLFSDYLSWMGKYSDAMESIDAIDEDSLSMADAQYYAEVQARVSKKLLDASL